MCARPVPSIIGWYHTGRLVSESFPIVPRCIPLFQLSALSQSSLMLRPRSVTYRFHFQQSRLKRQQCAHILTILTYDSPRRKDLPLGRGVHHRRPPAAIDWTTSNTLWHGTTRDEHPLRGPFDNTVIVSALKDTSKRGPIPALRQ